MAENIMSIVYSLGSTAHNKIIPSALCENNNNAI